MSRERLINGIPFILFRVSRKKTTANSVAKTLRNKGYYVRIIKTSRGYEIWVSKNPRWFYKMTK
jgi:histidinol-phosphate/aromatic aminotransferase/cobyric acid decarboxylase-like protein